MHAFGVVGAGADVAADQLAGGLDGRVAVIHDAATDGGESGVTRERPAATEYALSGDGWQASGDELTLGGVLDRLAPDHDYAVVVGFPEARLPQVVLGDAEADDPLVEAEDADALDPAAVAEALADRDPHETLESLVASVKESEHADRAGAIATFTGRVRAKDDPNDDLTEYLEFEKYEGVAEQKRWAIESDLEERDGVFEVAMHHRVGVIPEGGDIVFVVVLAGHREEAFRTVEDGIDRLKDEVPIFKKEVTSEETFWVHEK